MDSAFSIPNQRPDESVVFILRRHWTILSSHLISILFLFFLPVVLVVLAGDTLTNAVANRELIGILAVLGGGLYYLSIGLSFLHTWVDYSLDVWIVTTKRIANIEQKGLFSRVVSELQLENIQDVTVEVHGFFPTMLRYGDIRIQTAGETPRFFFDDIANPSEVARKIMDLHDAAVHARNDAMTEPKTSPPLPSEL